MSIPVVRSPRKLTATRREDPNVRYHYWPEERNYLNRMKTMLMHPELYKKPEPDKKLKRAITPQKRDHQDLYFHQWPDNKNYWNRRQIPENKGEDSKETQNEFRRSQEVESNRDQNIFNQLVPIQEEQREEQVHMNPPNGQFQQNPPDGQFPQNPPNGQFPQNPPNGQFPQNPDSQYYSSQDQAEMQEYDFYNVNNNLTTMVAPFGTNHTPPISVKIIGGQLVPVIERAAPNDPSGHRLYPLQPIADKPNNVDPKILTDRSKAFYSSQQPQDYGEAKEDNYSSHIKGKATYETRNRPDSKSLNPRSPLPPINANKQKNQMSTVFEQEPWVRNRNPPLQSDTEYKNHFDYRDSQRNIYENGTYNENFNDYRQDRNMNHQAPMELDSDTMELLRYLPGDKFLPDDPVTFPQHLEHRLMRSAARALRNFPDQSLRDVYIKATESDKDLIGWIRSSDLDRILKREKASLHPELFRLVCAPFVHRSRPGEVNYEKVLSFIGTAIRQSKSNNNEQVSDGRPQYYTRTYSPLKDASPFHDRELAKLINMTQVQLDEAGYEIDMEALFAVFQAKDRDHRDTLSADQIQDVIFVQRIPLQGSLIRAILSKCEHNNQPGQVQQYSWIKFYEFLQKVQPVKTGLPIPASKRPLDYAKQYPQPMDSWPKAKESPRMSPPMWKKENGFIPPIRRKRGSDAPLSDRSVASHHSTRRNIMWDKIAKLDQELHDLEEHNKGNNPSSPRKRDDYEQQQSYRNYQNPGVKNDQVWEKIKVADRDLKQLEETNKGEQQQQQQVTDYNDNKNQMLRDGIMEPWNSRFLKLANHLYAKDEQRRCDGTLPYQEVVKITDFFNKQYHLHIPEETIVRRAQDFTNDRDSVDLARFLDKIGNMEW